MAKESGLGITCAIDDAGGSARTISNDITNIQWTMPSEVQDITGVNSSGTERLLLLAEFTLTLNGVFNSAANQSHDVFKAVNVSSVTRTATLTHSAQILANEVFFNDYVLTRTDNGALTWAAPGELNSTTVPVWTTECLPRRLFQPLSGGLLAFCNWRVAQRQFSGL